MSSPQHVCGCGKSYTSSSSLAQHQRRHCRLTRGNSEEEECVCPVCRGTFTSYMGMRQHCRLRHPTEYNRDLQQEARSARRNWTEDEENALARAEAAHSGGHILDFLVTITNRSRDAISARRKTSRYKEKVQQFKADLEARQQQMALQLQRNDSPAQQRHQSTTDANDILRIDAELIAAISDLPPNQLAEADKELRNLILTSDKTEVITAFDEWCLSLVSTFKRSKNSRKINSPVDQLREALKNPKLSKSKKRALEYKISQFEYRRDVKAYAAKLLDETVYENVETRPSSETLEKQYREIFETESSTDDEPLRDIRTTSFESSAPITKEEIEQAVKSTKTNTPGPDNMTLVDVKKIGVYKLLLLFNTILYLEHIPPCFRQSRTVLIPKTKQDLHLGKNWRPITISNLLIRICNKILAKRLSKLELCDRQRGFSRIDGCFANFASLETILGYHQSKALPISIITLDLMKAFDLVSHHSIHRAMKRLNIDAKTRNIILKNYTDQSTTITLKNNTICSCAVRRGVKQGDPLSPILFNAVIDELLTELEEKFTGVKVGAAKVSCLAFADDLVLYANTPEDAQRMLNHCNAFFRNRGLKLNAAKCKSIVFRTVPSKKKLYLVTDPIFRVNDELIPSLTVEEQFRYLGHQFQSTGLAECTGEKLVNQLAIIRRAPLKPQQKFRIIKNHLIPRYIAVLQRPNVARKVLQKIDRTIRSTLKRVLSLHSHCSNTIFYAPMKVGGLGIFNFSRMIPLITLNRWDRVKEWSDLLQECYKLSEKWVSKYRKMIKEGEGSKEAVHQHQEIELRESFSGGGIAEVKHHPACNYYISRPPTFWTGEDFIRAIQLRFNLLPCKGMPSVPVQERRCRAGCYKTESISHILQNCPRTHEWRILRHDYVLRRLSSFARRKGWTVEIEPHIRCRNGSLKKPDIILERDRKIIICDVGINWEGEIPLSAQYMHKRSIYSTESFIQKVQELYPSKELFILPLIIGARGGWCAQNNFLIEHLKLSNTEVADLITTTIRGSLITHKQFMRATWRKRTLTVPHPRRRL